MSDEKTTPLPEARKRNLGGRPRNDGKIGAGGTPPREAPAADGANRNQAGPERPKARPGVRPEAEAFWAKEVQENSVMLALAFGAPELIYSDDQAQRIGRKMARSAADFGWDDLAGNKWFGLASLAATAVAITLPKLNMWGARMAHEAELRAAARTVDGVVVPHGPAPMAPDPSPAPAGEPAIAV